MFISKMANLLLRPQSVADQVRAIATLAGGIAGATSAIMPYYPDLTGWVFFAILFGTVGFAIGAMIASELVTLIEVLGAWPFFLVALLILATL